MIIRGEVISLLSARGILSGSGIVTRAGGLPFSPLDLEPLLWLDNRPGDFLNSSGTPAIHGQKIATWLDRSGSGNHFTQAVDTQRPSLNNFGISGHPAAAFDGANDELSRLPLTGVTGYTLVFVLQTGITANSSPGSNGLVLSSGFGMRIFAGNRNMVHGGVTGKAAAPAQSNPETWITRYSGGFGQFNVDNDPMFSGSIAAFNPPAGAFTVGAGGAGVYPWSGHIGNVLLFPRVLTDEELSALNLYLSKTFSP